jgi:transcriptional regulator with XRE-family HTH domain
VKTSKYNNAAKCKINASDSRKISNQRFAGAQTERPTWEEEGPMAKESVPTVRSRRLGRALRRFREERRLTLEEAGAGMERSLSSLSKVENGRSKLPVRDVRAMLDFYEITDERTRAALLGLARDSHKRGWWQRYGGQLSSSYLDFVSLEADAAAIRTLETILIPGLLQTEDYARMVSSAVPAESYSQSRDLDQLVAVRMARQKVLRGADPLQLWAILGEAALRYQVGGRDVMCAQLHRLLEVGELEHVVIQVLPYASGAHAGINGPYTVLEFPEPADLDVVLVETLTGGLYIETEDEIRRYNLVFNHLRMAALSSEESRALIEEVAKGL